MRSDESLLEGVGVVSPRGARCSIEGGGPLGASGHSIEGAPLAAGAPSSPLGLGGGGACVGDSIEDPSCTWQVGLGLLRPGLESIEAPHLSLSAPGRRAHTHKCTRTEGIDEKLFLLIYYYYHN